MNHGTLTAYTGGKCRCADCRAAMAEYRRKRRAELKGQPVPDWVEHGSDSTYKNYGCRCQACVAECKARYQRRKNAEATP